MQYRGKTISTVKVNSSHIVVDWVLGNSCNYACPYCWSDNNTGTHRVPPLDDTMRTNIDHLLSQLRLPQNNQDKPVVFILSRGEPTMYHDIDNLLDFLSSRGWVKLITNGSRTIRWWERYSEKLEEVAISYHVHTAEYDHVAGVIRSLLGKVKLWIHIMVPPDRFDDAIAAYHRFSRDFLDQPVNMLVKMLVDDHGKLYDYTAEQRNTIDQLPKHRPAGLASTNQRLDVTLITDSAEIVEWEPSAVKDMNGSFAGYKCKAHHEFVSIQLDGRCGKMHCGQLFSSFANIYSQDFTDLFRIPIDDITCQQTNCCCVGLYETNKQRI